MSRGTYFLMQENKRLKAEVERLSTDAVTGLAGRGVLDRAMVTGFARARRTGYPMGVLMIDVDHFKAVNDRFGHQAGDMTLHHVAKTLEGCIRAIDVLARYGGEEFVVLVDDANPVGLALLAENMRRAVASEGLPGYPPVTVSIGWAIQNPIDEFADDILVRADAAMYLAKVNGRNQVRRG